MEKHAEASDRFLVCPLPRNAVLLVMAFLVTGNFGCATVDLDVVDVIETNTENNDDSESGFDSNRTDSSESDSETQDEEETDSEIVEDSEDSDAPVDSETETDTVRDTSSTDIHCPSYSHGWPCTCRKLILGCDDGSECIGLEGILTKKQDTAPRVATRRLG